MSAKVVSPSVEFIDRRNVRLVEIWGVRTSEGVIVVLPGAVSDGASIPSFLWSVPGMAAFQGDTFAASFVHDMLYSAELVKRDVADRLFREILRNSGVGVVRANLMYGAARAFGGVVWSRHTPESIAEARKFVCWYPLGGRQ